MKITYLLILIVFLAGCATTPEKMNRLSIGMTKIEVLDAIGRPSSTASPGKGVEFLRYRKYYGRGDYITYFVRLVDGRVDSYGKTGDFDSTKDPTLDLNIKNQ